MSLGTASRPAMRRRIRRASGGFWATMRISAVIPVSDLPFLAVTVGLRVLQFAVFVGIWRSLPQHQLDASGMTLSALLTYSALAQAIGPVLNPTTTLSAHVANGSLTVRLLWPLGVVSQFVSEMLGSVLSVTAVSATAIAVASLVMGVPLAPTGAPLLFAVSLVLAVVVGVAVDFWFALLTVRLGNGIWFVTVIRGACTVVISGALIPLALMPWHIGDFLEWLPFAAMVSGPLRVYTQESGALTLLASQAAWAVALWLGLVWAVRRSRDKVVGYGG